MLASLDLVPLDYPVPINRSGSFCSATIDGTDQYNLVNPTECFPYPVCHCLLAPTTAIEYKGHRSVVQQLDLHVCTKDPCFHMSSEVL